MPLEHLKRRSDSARVGQRLASSSGPYPGSAAPKHVSFGRRLERGPSPAYSRERRSYQTIGLAPEVDHTGNSSEGEGTIDSPSQQLWNEEEAAATTRRLKEISDRWDATIHGPLDDDVYEQSRKRSRPVTEAYEQQNSSSSFQFSQKPLSRISPPRKEHEKHRDEEVCRRVHKLRAQIVDFAQAYVTIIAEYARRPSVESLCGDVYNAKLVRYIGYLAQGGANGLDSWQEMLTDKNCLNAIVVGIVSMALKEYVFSALWFGGTHEEIEELEQLQEEEKEDDGYKRTKSRAHACWHFSKDTSNHVAAAHEIAIALRKLLTPLLNMSESKRTDLPMPEILAHELFEIVAIAGQLSREMRMCGNVIYHWSPTFKDEEFAPEHMECLNITSMIRNSPYELKKQSNGQNRSVLKSAAEKAEAIVRITAFPGLVAYRKGGGALAKELLSAEKHKEQQSKANLPPDVQRLRSRLAGTPLTGDEGFRLRVICKSVVHLEWGQQRLLTREAGTSRHLDAMRDGGIGRYEDDRRGFVELFDYFLQVHPDFEHGMG